MAVTVARSAVLYDGVELGDGSVVEEFVLLGVAPHGCSAGGLTTRVGPQALVRSHAVVYAGNTIGARFQTGHGAMIREANEIGDDVSIGSHSIVEHHVRIGRGVRIHSNAFVPEHSVLEDGVWIGPNAVLTNARYPHSPDAKANLRGPHILPGAKIGANATILPGVTIGRNALVGAGSVVVNDVPDGKVVVGNPARVVRDISELAAYRVDELLDGAGKGR